MKTSPRSLSLAISLLAYPAFGDELPAIPYGVYEGRTDTYLGSLTAKTCFFTIKPFWNNEKKKNWEKTRMFVMRNTRAYQGDPSRLSLSHAGRTKPSGPVILPASPSCSRTCDQGCRA